MTRADTLRSYKDLSAGLQGLIPNLDKMRSSAMQHLLATGLPEVKSELWRYSNIHKITDVAYSLANADDVNSADNSSDTLNVKSLASSVEDVAARFVFVDGRYHEDLSFQKFDTEKGQSSPQIDRLGDHFKSDREEADQLEIGRDGLGWLNTALLTDGLAITAPAGMQTNQPIEIVYISTTTGKKSFHPRIVINLGEGSRLTVIERFSSTPGSDAWINAISQIKLSKSSFLKHLRLVGQSSHSSVTGCCHIQVEESARYMGLVAAIAGGLIRLETHAKILGEKAHATINGLSLAARGEKHENLVHVDHQIGYATSDQIYRAVACGQGSSSFSGKIIVAKDAQKTEADQSFKALVLDRAGEVNAKPELEILADDVKCSHGATIGELDIAALFYMEARGIDPAEARQLLVRSFLADVLIDFDDTVFFDIVSDRIARWFDTTDPAKEPASQKNISGSDINDPGSKQIDHQGIDSHA